VFSSATYNSGMPRSFWSGSISFGLVYIPVKLFGAVAHQEVRFHEVHDKDGARINEKRFCSKEGVEVPYEHIAKGYPISKQKMVLISQRELEAADPKSSRVIDIQDFVDLNEIDPVYFLHTYYLSPGSEARKAYSLLLRAMQKTGKVAIAKIVIRQKQYLAALRPVGNALMLSTMLYADEIVPARGVPGLSSASAEKVSEKEIALAQKIVKSLSESFKPSKYKDTYRERVLAIVRRKGKGQKIPEVTPTKVTSTRVADLLKQLEQSVVVAKR
jgi:DNA end-binding protein Ku